MRQNYSKIALVLLLTTNVAFSWGGQPAKAQNTQSEKKVTKTPENNAGMDSTQNPSAEEAALSVEEKKFLVLNKLKTSSPRATSVYYDGSTIPLNIPLFHPTIINLPVPIAEMIFVNGTGVDLIEDPLQTKSNILKIRSISPVLNDYELQLRLINNEWIRLKISTNLKTERYSKINILSPENKEKDIQKLREKYFSRKYSIKNITKKENVKAINLIVDRLDTESKKHMEQVEIEEKINKFITKEERFGIFLESSVVEPFEVVSEYKPNLNTLKENKELILLNLMVHNFGEDYLEMTPSFIKNLFPNYISFWYDLENNKIAPKTKGKLIIVIEDTNPDL